MGRVFRQVLILIATAVCVFYLYYRLFYTLNLSSPYAIFASVMLYVAEAIGCVLLWLYFLQVWDLREPPPPGEPPPNMTVDILVPTYNEDVQLLRTTLLACLNIEYPHKTYVLDDGRRPAVAELAKELGVEYITRPDNKHAKAGNLNHALKQTHGDFVVIFDADHVAAPQFLCRLLGYFRDEKLGFVQTPHAFYNFESFQATTNFAKKKYWEEGQLFYNVIQSGKNRWNAVVFAGSAAIFRRRALEEVGYIAVETITEDLHTGMRVCARGWKSLFINERLIAGQAATDVTTHHTQRLRWGEGNLSILAHDNPLTMPGLTLGQRLSFFTSIITWTNGIPKLLIYLTPILMLFSGVPPVAEFTWTLGIVTASYLAITMFVLKIVSRGYGSIVDIELANVTNFYTQIQSTRRAIFGRKKQKFVVTSKRGRQSKSILPLIAPHCVLVVLSVAALVWAGLRASAGLTTDLAGELIVSILVLFHLYLDIRVIRRALKIDNNRYSYRHRCFVPVRYQVKAADGSLVEGHGITSDLNDTGIRLITYQPLPSGQEGTFILSAAGVEVECVGTVRYGIEAPNSRHAEAGCCRCGIQFKDPSAAQTDGLNFIAMQYAVPKTYAYFNSRRSWWDDLKMWATRSWRRQSKRYPYCLPIVFAPSGPPERREYAVTQDISLEACRVLTKQTLAEDQPIEFLLPTPIGEVAGTMSVLRKTNIQLPSGTFNDYVLKYASFQGPGLGMLARVLAPGLRPQMEFMLESNWVKMPTAYRKPVLASVAILAILGPTLYFAFQWSYRDELFLKTAAAEATLPVGEQSRIDRIYQATMAERNPSTEKLLFLRDLTEKEGQYRKAEAISRILVERYPQDLDMKLALADELTNRSAYDEAETEYNQLIERMRTSDASPEKRRLILVAAARNAVNAGKLDLGAERFQEAMAVPGPVEPALRNELAGVLAKAGRYKEATALYDGVELDLGARYELAAIYSMSGNLSKAEEQCRTILEQHPEEDRAKRLLAEILIARSEFTEPARLYQELLAVHPGDRELRLKLAQLALWASDYSTALRRFQLLLDAGLDQPDVATGFIDAASSAPTLDESQRLLALKLYDAFMAHPPSDAVELARFGWVLHRLGEGDKSVNMLEQAVALAPEDRNLRLQLANELQDLGQFERAAKQYDALLEESKKAATTTPPPAAANPRAASSLPPPPVVPRDTFRSSFRN